MRLKSTVKWFNHAEGYGFIVPLEKSDLKDIFIHHTEINDGRIEEGDSVEFDLSEGKKGWSAANLDKVT